MKYQLSLLTLFLSLLNFEYLSAQEVKEKLSLNGYWKFHTIYGEGSNYMNIVASEEDIVVDNDHPDNEMQGEWQVAKLGERNTRFYGKDYLKHLFTLTNLNNENKADSAFFRFKPKLKKSAYYEVFIRYPFASHLTAQCNVKHRNGISTKYVSQRVFCGEWISLGIYDFAQKEDNYIELTAIVSGTVAADAAMFREISAEKYLKAKEEPNQVFLTNFDDSKWFDTPVPGHWGMNNNFSNYTGIGWYRKSIELPQNWSKTSDHRYYLKFDGVYHLSRIYLNGKFIGMNRGGFTPFEFDVTDALNFERKNVIAVQADNSAVVGATWNWGGIIRDVALKRERDVRIDYQYIHAEPDLESGKADVSLLVKIENNSNRKRSIQVSSQILDGKEIAKLERTLELVPGTQQKWELKTVLDKSLVELWHFDHPKLYQVKTVISEANTVLDLQEDNFGIRKVAVTEDHLLLNGEPVRLAGFNRVSESRFWGSSEPLHVLEEDVDLMKEAGANFMRIMHGTQNEKLIDLCDRKGIMLFEEVNVRDLDNDEFRANYVPLDDIVKVEGGINITEEDEEILMLDKPYIKVSKTHNITPSAKNYFLAKYWLKGMIERDLNHPSIIGWSVGNELNNHFEYGRKAIAYVKQELDPHRLVTCVSNSGQKTAYTPQTDPNTFVDIIMHNMYRWQGEPQAILDTLRSKWPNKPIFISEFGFDPFPSTAPDADKVNFSEWTNNFRGKNKFVVGTSMWTFNDYRSAYAGTTAEENRVWGVITTWRQKRRLFDRIKREYAPVKDIEVKDINFRKNTACVSMPVRDKSDYPSHSMRNYKLGYQFRNTEGAIIYKNAIALPAILPEDGKWSGSISWDELEGDVLDLTLNLVTPTDYTRLDKTISFRRAITPKISEVISGKNSIRILFDKVPNATEYEIAYTDGSTTKTSHKTISNHIDIEGLQSGDEYRLQLFAINDKGKSQGSEQVVVSTNDKALPPLIWDSFIAHNKLVIGYSSEFEDGNYIIKYGDSKDHLDKEFISNVRGMVSIDLDEVNTTYFQLRREINGALSNWSNIVKTKVK